MHVLVSTSPITAWLAGLAGFFVTSIALSGNLVSQGDVPAILIWAGFGVLISMPAIFWPLLRLLEIILEGRDPVFAFPLVGVVIALPTTMLAGLVFGGNPLNMAAMEFATIFSFFAPVGIVGGMAFVYRSRSVAG